MGKRIDYLIVDRIIPYSHYNCCCHPQTVDWWAFAMVGYYLATGGKHAFLGTDEELNTFFMPL